MLDQVLAAPQQYQGQNIVVEGVLAASGQGFYKRYFLKGREGRQLEVTPWAPLEIYTPPSAQGRPAAQAMHHFVGRRLRLAGHLEKRAEGFILKVSTAEEL